MHKPLVISRSFLLEKSATGQIQRFFWEYLYNDGIRPTIICTKNRKKENAKGPLNCNVIPTYDSHFVKQLFRIIKHTIYSDIDKNPDSLYYSWGKLSAFKKAKEEAIKGNYDYIESIQLPGTSHLIALEAKKASGLPWIASFYDPWYDNPLRPIKHLSLREKDKRREALIAQNADAIIHTNQAIYDEWVERYGESIKEKMFVLPLVFNPPKRENVVNVIDDNKEKKYNISHIGTLYLDRTSVDFLKAIRLMLDNHPELRSMFIVNYVGTVTPKDKEFIEENGLSDIVNFAGFLKEADCNNYYEKSDLFLAIDAKTARNIFFPSKIMKYFFYRKPILGMTPPGSALQYELEKSHNYVFGNEETESIANFLYHAITDNKYLAGFDIDYWKNYTMEYVAPQYFSIVERVLNRIKVCYK